MRQIGGAPGEEIRRDRRKVDEIGEPPALLFGEPLPSRRVIGRLRNEAERMADAACPAFGQDLRVEAL